VELFAIRVSNHLIRKSKIHLPSTLTNIADFFYIIRQTEELYDKYILPKSYFPLSVACVDL
jgi:hypothetical protein